MRVFGTKSFARLAKKASVSDEMLIAAVGEMRAERSSASLSRFLYKVRMSRPNEGKSGGYRAIIVLTDGKLCLFVHMFAKNVTANLSDRELAGYRKFAKLVSELKDQKIDELLKSGEWIEVSYEKDTDKAG